MNACRNHVIKPLCKILYQCCICINFICVNSCLIFKLHLFIITVAKTLMDHSLALAHVALWEIHSNLDANNPVIVSRTLTALTLQPASTTSAEIHAPLPVRVVETPNVICATTPLFASVLDKLPVIHWSNVFSLSVTIIVSASHLSLVTITNASTHVPYRMPVVPEPTVSRSTIATFVLVSLVVLAILILDVHQFNTVRSINSALPDRLVTEEYVQLCVQVLEIALVTNYVLKAYVNQLVGITQAAQNINIA